MLPALSPLGRLTLPLPPASSVGADGTQTGEGAGEDSAAVEQQDAGRLPAQAAGADALQQAAEASGGPGQQGSSPWPGSRRSKENAPRLSSSAACAAQQRRRGASATKIRGLPADKAQQADSEDTVTISGLNSSAEGLDTDDESVPAGKVCGCLLRPALHALVTAMQILAGLLAQNPMTHFPATCLHSSQNLLQHVLRSNE